VSWWNNVKAKLLGSAAVPPTEEAPPEASAAPTVRRTAVPADLVPVFPEQAWRVYAPESPDTHHVTLLWGRDPEGACGVSLVGEPNCVDLVEYRILDPIAGIYVPGMGHVKGPHTVSAEQFESCMLHIAHETAFEVVRLK
jgi:hypothetical protein